MGTNLLSPMEIDAIGEILNISLGASATAVSNMLDARVDITTPVVTVVTKEEFTFEKLEPAVGVEITYVEGLEGKNVMLLKKDDVRIIVDMLMGVETPKDEFELNEMSISAICEVMNQMMGASATALSELLGRTVNISTPRSEEIENGEDFKEKNFADSNPMVVVHFSLRIADKMESEFVNLMSVKLAKELVAGFFPNGVPQEETGDSIQQTEKKDETGRLEATGKERTDSAPAAASTQNVNTDRDSSGHSMSQEEIDRLREQNVSGGQDQKMPRQDVPGKTIPDTTEELKKMQEIMQEQMKLMQQMQQEMLEASRPKQISVHPAPSPNLQDVHSTGQGEVNMDLVLGVPVEVSVEIGRTRKYVRDVLELNKGSLVVLDKLAGEQVDLFVNGQCIAKGDVVVVNDNFGIRITEIIQENLEIPM